MKKILTITLIIFTLLFVSCSSEKANEQNEEIIENKIEQNSNQDIEVEIKEEENTLKVESETVDVEISKDNDSLNTQTIIDFEDSDLILDEDLLETEIEDWCMLGETYNTNYEGQNIEVELLGLTDFKNSIWCEGIHEKELEGIGLITTQFYINQNLNEYYTYSKTPLLADPIENHIILE